MTGLRREGLLFVRHIDNTAGTTYTWAAENHDTELFPIEWNWGLKYAVTGGSGVEGGRATGSDAEAEAL